MLVHQVHQASILPWPPEECDMLPPPICPKPYRLGHDHQELPIPLGPPPYVLAKHEIYFDWKLEDRGGQKGGSVGGGYRYTW